MLKKENNIKLDVICGPIWLSYVVLFFLLSNFSGHAQNSKIIIDKAIAYQTIEGFGASDAWRCQFVGSNWPESKKERIAELLFSKELDSKDNPKGIGLSMWRFYIGAGTTEQGIASEIPNEWRRAESFIDSDGNYNWEKQEGQQWFLKKAKDYAVEKFLAFSISAPVYLTKNGKGFNSDLESRKLNLKEDKFDDYATFMFEVLKHFKTEGIDFDYLSPVNEPQWEWEKKTQEGTPATNEDITELVKFLNNKLENSSLKTNLAVAESADLRWLYSGFNKPKRGNQIDYFFGNEGTLKNLSRVKPVISGHSYFTTWPVDSLVRIRLKLKKRLKKHNLEYWQSEFCILENNPDTNGGNKRDLGMDTALYVARVIHADLTLTNASSWQWWTALSNADFKDGLIYLDTDDSSDLFNLEKLKNDGAFRQSKLLWAFGNYSRFIRPGMRRINIAVGDLKSTIINLKDIMLSAYINEAKSKIVVVAINYGHNSKNLDTSNYDIDSMYVTSENKNLEKTKTNKKTITLEARSISTLVGSF